MICFVILAATFSFVVGDEIIFDNNMFFIYNRVYHNARLAQWGTNEIDIGTHEHGIYEDQLWLLKPHPRKKGCYYMANGVHQNYRIVDHRDRNLIVFSGNHYDDQLFRFEPVGKYYYIKSCLYKNDRLAKFGHGN